ncbi:ATP-dependent helicase [Spiroplasma eriocheiris]|uniref:DNA 3'-5' helicase n=1 Tax=Spiroplasma eriocheiris TaxID=315358 RepID=A0A0H3XM25_9MOLU|nr:UvrD-helicase domain-containing protein [Spiroplasma eriocheiris]AHF57450.1 putative ATP-dependent DNA helicase [Spiroplasma eriocheiris CCTCC M 207170]AKM53907.1 ATP-dependent DNA helicase [Spiroplasma eriocheiris]
MLNEFIKDLNPNQREAVLAINGPVRVIAGAGSGKTRVIINKIAYLVRYGNHKPWRICALTFTNKAANEMKNRIVDLIGQEGRKTWISTYHALCVRILREDIETLGYPRSFNIIDTTDQDQIIRTIYKSANLKYDAQESRVVKSQISSWKNDFYSPSQVIDGAYENSDKKRWGYVYKEYEKRLKELNSLDFNDLILFTHRLFSYHKDILAKWQDRFDYLLVDEFQDTNDLQFDIIKWLSETKQNITVVGDPDQTIYSWRGAKIRLILNFEHYFKETQTIILDENYRSSQNILSLANDLIVNNTNRIKKELFTSKELGVKPILYHASSSLDESDFIASKIIQLVKKEDYHYQDILILYRANYLSRDIEGSLADYGISYRIYGAFKFYERKEIKDALALLKLVVNNEELALDRVLLFTPKIGPKAVEQVKAILKEHQVTFSQLLLEHFDLLPNSLKNNLTALSEAIFSVNSLLQDTQSVKIVIETLLEKSGYLKRLEDNLETERVENIKELIDGIAKFDFQNADLQGLELVNEYLQLISLQTDHDNDEINDDSVSLMTIHNAKGLENKVVFIVGLNEGIFPSIQAIKSGESELEEERRTLYVAITRARELLFISYADGYSYVTGNERFPSRFVKELNPDFLETIESDLLGTTVKYKSNYSLDGEWENSLSNFSNNALNTSSQPSHENWSIDDSVSHEIFGIGVVVKKIGANIQVIFPSPIGSKIISADSKAIKKVKN